MSSQSRVRSAIWTTLVLLVVAISATSALAAPTFSDVIATAGEQNATQQNLAATATPTPPAGISRGAEKQSEQGRQYGQPGFVGEPINLNVVNADIRDILNYITEQYG